MNTTGKNEQVTSRGLRFESRSRGAVLRFIGCAVVYFAAVSAGHANDRANPDNAVCARIAAEGGACPDLNVGYGGTPAPPKSPKKQKVAEDFPVSTRSGLPTAEDGPVIGGDRWPGSSKPKPDRNSCQLTKKKCKGDAACIERAADLCN